MVTIRLKPILDGGEMLMLTLPLPDSDSSTDVSLFMGFSLLTCRGSTYPLQIEIGEPAVTFENEIMFLPRSPPGTAFLHEAFDDYAIRSLQLV